MMKFDSTNANAIFEKCLYKSDVKNALNVLKSDNVYDIFKRIDDVYESKKHNKNAFTFFQHIKSAYDNMTDVEKEVVTAEEVEALKKYSRKTFYTNRSETESQQVDSESEEDISEEDSKKDKERLDVLKRTTEVESKSDLKKTSKPPNIDVVTESLKKMDAQVKYLMEQVEVLKKAETERVEVLKKTDAEVKGLTEQVERQKKTIGIIMSSMEYWVKGKVNPDEAYMMMTRTAVSLCLGTS